MPLKSQIRKRDTPIPKRGREEELRRVAEVGSLSARAKMAIIFVKRVFTIFATNASFLRVTLHSSSSSLLSQKYKYMTVIVTASLLSQL